LELNPDNHPLTMTYANLLLENKQFSEAASELQKHVNIRPNDPHLWQRLSEAQGKSSNQVGMFRSRAEFLFLTGQKSKALKQLQTALKLAGEHYLLAARIEQRAREMDNANESLEF